MIIESVWAEKGPPKGEIWTQVVELDFASGAETVFPLFLLPQLPTGFGTVNETFVAIVDSITLVWTEAPDSAGTSINFRVGTEDSDFRVLGINTESGKAIGDYDVFGQDEMNNPRLYKSSGAFLQVSSQGNLTAGKALCQISLTQDYTRYYKFDPETGV